MLPSRHSRLVSIAKNYSNFKALGKKSGARKQVHRSYNTIHHLKKYHNNLVVPKFGIIIVFSFSWDDCKSQKKLKTMIIQTFLFLGGGEGDKKIVMVFSKVVNLVKILQGNAFFTRLKIDRGFLSSALSKNNENLQNFEGKITAWYTESVNDLYLRQDATERTLRRRGCGTVEE